MLIIGHRGDRKKFPDNSIEGLQSAFDRGADGVEFDVHWRPETGVYLTHQYLHDKTKNYPKLEEVLEKFGGKGRLSIEIKTPEVEAVKVISGIIEQYQPKNFELTSSVYPLVKYIKDILPQAEVGLIANSLVEDWWTVDFGNYFLESYLKLTGADGLIVGALKDFWNKDRVDWFHKRSYRVGAHLFTDKKDEFEKMKSYGLDCCTVDDLDVLRWK